MPEPDPELWIRELRAHGYGAAVSPVNHTAPEDLARKFATAATSANVVIGEIGAWSNPISRILEPLLSLETP